MRRGLKKRIDRQVGKAIVEWGMIRENERILVGLSGGRDSQVLLKILFEFQKKAPVHFQIFPVYVDAGFEDSFAEDLKQSICAAYESELIVEYTDHGRLAHSGENRENPCFLCSRLRRKRLFEIAAETNCRKIALGHHKDDIIETLFMNIFYSGRIAAMKPCQSFFQGTIDIIRPLSYVDKSEIDAFSGRMSLPVFKNTCPSAGRTKRSEVRKMLEEIYTTNKHIKGNIFRSMQNIVPEYLLESKNDRYPEST